MMAHVQALYCHESSLGTVVKIQLKDDIKYYQGKNLRATEEDLQGMFETTFYDLEMLTS